MREAREARGESLQQVSQAIKIRPSMLELIEAGHFYGLTDPLYLKGFIKAYSAHVGLSEDEVMPFFRREYDEQENEQRQLKQPLTPIEPKKSKLTPGWIVAGFLALAVVLLVGYSYHQYVSLALTPTLQVDSPSDGQSTKDSQVTVSGKTDPDATLTLNGQSVQLDPNGHFSLSVGLAVGSNNLQLQAVNKLGKQTEVDRTVVSLAQPAAIAKAPIVTPSVLSATTSASPSARLGQASKSAILQPVPSPSPTPSVQPINPVEVKVVVGPSSAWLEVSSDGTAAFSGVLLPGASQTFTAKTKIHLKTGNGGSTRIFLHGVDQGLLGAESEVVERDYTP